ncbi:MAG: ATP-grasp domain-containing protein [Tepidanaerobacteraceae bacterium]
MTSVDITSKVRNKVIVIGTDHYNTLGVVRSLGEKGIPIYLILIAQKEAFVNKSKYVTQRWLVDSSEKGILDILIRNFNNEKYKPIIIPTSDFAVKIIDDNLDMLKAKYITPNIKNTQGKITKLMNKKTMNEIAIKSGLTVPKTWEIFLNNQYRFPDELTFPCIVKPVCSVEGKKEDIVVCKNQLALKNNLFKLKNSYNRVLIQEYVDGEDAIMVNIAGYIAINRHIILPAIIEKVREYPLNTGSTSYAKAVKSSVYVKNVNKIYGFLSNLGYSGLFDIDFKFAKNKLYFIEINFRNGASGYALTKAGVNLPYLWYLEASGLNIDKFKNEIDKDFYFMMEFMDIRHVLNGDVKVITWLKDLIRTRSFLFINLKDMKPLLFKFSKIFT